MSFWAELKRRNVVRVGAIYLAAAWLLAQIGDVVSQAFAAPGWPMRVLLVLLALGLPIVLVIAWLFELTPEGVKLTREVDVETSITHATGRRLDRVLIGMIALLIVVLVANRWWPSSTAPKPAESAAAQAASAGAATPASSAQSEKSVAVLPFVNLSSDPEQEYFSDGLSEEILNQLAQIAELRVTARTSSFFFKGKNEDLRVIGQQLNARYLLEGSVRKAGNELRITAQLIDALAGSHLWSRTFDRTLNDVFAIQEEIAMAVSGAMSVSLDVGAMARTRGGTTNLEAYDKYLRARAFDRQRGTSDDLVQAAQYYREALALDPAFIRAASDLYLELASWLIYVPDRVAESRQEMATILARLQQLAPASPFTMTIVANQLLEAHRWRDAEQAIAAATAAGANFRLDITSVDTIVLLNTGRVRESMPRVRQRRETDPLSLNASYGWQIMLTLAGRMDDAEAEYARSRSLSGEHGLVDSMALLRSLSSRATDPASLRAQLGTLSRDQGPVAVLKDAVIADVEHREAALTTLHRLFIDETMQNSGVMLWLAGFADYFDDPDLALAALRRAYVDFGGTNLGMIWRPYRNPLRNDPRFKDILRDVGLVDYFRDSGNWGDYCRPISGGADFECN
jgi:TolB-like protein